MKDKDLILYGAAGLALYSLVPEVKNLINKLTSQFAKGTGELAGNVAATIPESVAVATTSYFNTGLSGINQAQTNFLNQFKAAQLTGSIPVVDVNNTGQVTIGGYSLNDIGKFLYYGDLNNPVISNVNNAVNGWVNQALGEANQLANYLPKIAW